MLLSGECVDLELAAPVSPGNMEAIHPGLGRRRWTHGGKQREACWHGARLWISPCRVPEPPADFPPE